MIQQNLWDAAKAVVREKFIVINAYINKQKNLKQSYFTPQGTRKRRINEAQSQQKECENKLETNKIKQKRSLKLRDHSLKR